MDEEQRLAPNALATGHLGQSVQYMVLGAPFMVEQRQSAMQRIQVGIIGLVVVLLFVSLANMVLDRVTGGQSTSELPNSEVVAAEQDKLPDEPLAELGVTPVAKEEEVAKVIEEPAQNIRQVPAQPQP
jgi:hypothetical protein